MSASLREILDSGTIGYFWVGQKGLPDVEAEPERGYLSREGGWAKIILLDEDPLASLAAWGLKEPIEFPEAIIGIMPDEAALLLELVGPMEGQQIMGHRASSKQYLARTVVGAVPLDRLRSPRLRELHAHFLGVGRWAGMSSVDESRRHGPDGRLEGWSVTLGGGDKLSHKLPGGRSLAVSPTWKVDGPADNRTLSAPVSVGTTSRKPAPVEELLQPILDTQDLLSFAYEGFVTAVAGSAQLDVKPAEKGRLEPTPSLWNGLLMTQSPAVQTRAASDVPLFDLQTIGGIAGLARWIGLVSAHPRMARPIVRQFRQGRTTPSLMVLEIGAACEYWALVNRPAKWAVTPPRRGKWAGALAGRCGKAFSGWVGNRDEWAGAFWGTYNKLKHSPRFDPDPTEIHDLAESGRFLISAALLDRAAGSRAPSRSIFRSYRLESLGARLRDRYP